MDRLTSLFLGLLFVVATAWPAGAASGPSVQFAGPLRLVRTDDQLAIEVQMDSAGRQINASELYIKYPADRLKIIRIGREQSIWPVWPEDPSWDEGTGTIKLLGGRPKGIIASGATVATMYFSVRQSGPVELSLLTPDSKIFLHDGQGTSEALPSATLSIIVADPLVGGLILRSATHPTRDSWSRDGRIDVNWDVESDTIFSYTLSQDRTAVPDEVPDQLTPRINYSGLEDGVYYFTIRTKTGTDSWSDVTQRRFLLDATAPEPFAIESINTPAVPGQTLLSWLAIDQTAGVENYRLLVGGRDQGIVTSPLSVITDWADRTISIIATDAAGNRRTSELAAATSAWPVKTIAVVAAAGLLLVCGILLYARRIRRHAGL